MCFYAIIPLQINRSWLELCFHNSERFFYFPSVVINLCDLWCIIFKICEDRVKSIVFFFFWNHIIIDVIGLFFCYFTVVCEGSFFNKSAIVILITFLYFIAVIYGSNCMIDLIFSDLAEIVSVFDGVCNDEVLIKFNSSFVIISFNPLFFIKNQIKVFLSVFNFAYIKFFIRTFNTPSCRIKAPVFKLFF